MFNAYQQTQSEKVEKAMLGATYVSSFIALLNGKPLNMGSDIQYQRSLGSCVTKLQKRPGVSCAEQ